MGLDGYVFRMPVEEIPDGEDWCAYEVLHVRIGNGTMVAYLAVLVEGLPDGPARFPLILTRVLYSGTHCGDQIDVGDIEALRREVEALPVDLPEDVIEGGLCALFKAKLLALCDAALTLGTSIHF